MIKNILFINKLVERIKNLSPFKLIRAGCPKNVIIETTDEFIQSKYKVSVGLIHIESIPLRLRTETMYIAAIKHCRHSLFYVPNKERSYIMCELAVSKRGDVLHLVPNKHKTYELCKLAISTAGDQLFYVPKKLIDYNLAMIAVKNGFFSIKDVPEHLIDNNILEAAIRTNPTNIRFIRKSFHSPSLCRLAVSLELSCLNYVYLESDKLFSDCNQLKAWNTVLSSANKLSIETNLSGLKKNLINSLSIAIPASLSQDILDELATTLEHLSRLEIEHNKLRDNFIKIASQMNEFNSCTLVKTELSKIAITSSL